MEGFSLAEVGREQASTLWLRGGFPRSCLAANDENSLIRRRDVIRTLLESDLPQLGVRVPADLELDELLVIPPAERSNRLINGREW